MGTSPPPYKVASYRNVQSTRRLRRIFSVRRGLAVLVAVQLSWLYLWNARGTSRLSAQGHNKFEAGLASCASIHTLPTRLGPEDRKENPRWNAVRGQNGTIVLRNATLFNGNDFVEVPVDIVFSKGLIVSVSPTGSLTAVKGAEEHDLHGAHVTPGLVDMHSHHMAMSWPLLESTEDSNEVHADFGPLTPFVRAIDSMKAYDVATKRIASGGVTSSLIIPGSANIMGGEGTLVKNAIKAGPNGEYVIEETLLEHGIAFDERKRYMKMACGENPRGVYHHTRMGNAWVLRKWLEKASKLMEKQDEWCEAAQTAINMQQRAMVIAGKGNFPQDLELDSTVGLLRGRVSMQNHCYEPEDFETMLRISHEFGFRVRAFHHAISAWQVPEMLKEYGQNVTIATFAEFALYKQEAYAASLSAGKILNDHGVPIAYKSDHAMEDTSAQYLLLQSAIGHSFGLPADKALQAVTSVPARALDIDDRVGFVLPGYDADIVVWDSHPLSIGATPRQVFIDGIATLNPLEVEQSSVHVAVRQTDKPTMRATIAPQEREQICAGTNKGQAFVISGISKSFLEEAPGILPEAQNKFVHGNITLVIDNGKITCLGYSRASCVYAEALLYENRRKEDIVTIQLQDGYLTRGLIAVTSALGMAEIPMDTTTGDGLVNVVSLKEAKDGDNVDHAKYGVSLGGSKVKAKTFARARLGGVTRAVQPPMSAGGLIVGVSTGIRTSQNSTLLNGGLFQEDVAMHITLGPDTKANEGSISMGVQRLRGLLKGEENIWALVANGSLPLVIKADSTHDIQQVILLKRDYSSANVVLYGGHEAPLFAREIADANIPLILTAYRPSPDAWSKRESLPGPPLSRSPADILSEAGVFYAIALNTDGGPPGDSRIQSLALEAAWAAKYAGLTEHEALRLVSTNVEQILGLEKSHDIVAWEGNPLNFGTPVLTFQSQNDQLQVASCWPNEADE